MGRNKENKTIMNDAEFDPEKIKVGDIVEIRWYDVHAYERIEIGEIDELEEPESTICWGAVVRKGAKYLFIASEIGDKDSDGVWIEALPYNMIDCCKIISEINIDSRIVS